MDISQYRKSFGCVIAKYRKQKGLSQEELSFLMESHRNYIGRLERGEQSPTLDFCVRLAGVLGVKLSVLVGEAGG